MHNKKWTQEEVEYLKKSWGNVSISGISRKLDRTEKAILIKVKQLKLGAFLENNDNMISLNMLLMTIYNTNGGYKKTSWCKRGLKLHKQRVNTKVFEMVNINEFWEWAKDNQDFLNFSKFEKYTLGIEPEWVEKKRQRDISKQNKVKNVKWTKGEDDYLLMLLKQYKYSYDELSVKLQRSCGAIQRRILDLGYKERPVRRDSHEKWDNEQIAILKNMIQSGNNYFEMQTTIGKSEKAIRGKVSVLYGSECLDKVRKLLNN